MFPVFVTAWGGCAVACLAAFAAVHTTGIVLAPAPVLIGLDLVLMAATTALVLDVRGRLRLAAFLGTAVPLAWTMVMAAIVLVAGQRLSAPLWDEAHLAFNVAVGLSPEALTAIDELGETTPKLWLAGLGLLLPMAFAVLAVLSWRADFDRLARYCAALTAASLCCAILLSLFPALGNPASPAAALMSAYRAPQVPILDIRSLIALADAPYVAAMLSTAPIVGLAAIPGWRWPALLWSLLMATGLMVVGGHYVATTVTGCEIATMLAASLVALCFVLRLLRPAQPCVPSAIGA